MRMSWIVCENCYQKVPPPYSLKLPTDNDEQLLRLLTEVRQKNVKCPVCGGHHWIRKVASKL